MVERDDPGLRSADGDPEGYGDPAPSTSGQRIPNSWNKAEADRLGRYARADEGIGRSARSPGPITGYEQHLLFTGLCARYDELVRYPRGYNGEGREGEIDDLIDLSRKLKRMGMVVATLEGYAYITESIGVRSLSGSVQP